MNSINAITLDQGLISLIESWIWPFFRVAGMVMSAPIIGTRSIPMRVRLIIAIAITMIMVPVIPVSVVVEPLSMQGVLISIQQVLIGIAMGLCIRVVFIVLEIAGQLIGQLMGLMLASMVDPQNGNQVPIIGQLYLILATLLFLSFDGHLIMIQGLAASFQQLPVGMGGITREGVGEFLYWINTVLGTAVLISLPAVSSLLIVNLSFGVMTRAAPQMNIFAVGFPIMIILGMFIILFTLDNFLPQMHSLFDESFLMLRKLLEY